MSKTRNRWHVCRLAASVVLLAVTASPGIASGLPASATAAVATSVSTMATVTTLTTLTNVTLPAPPGPVSMTLESVTPAVAPPRASVVLSGTIRNTASFPIDKPVVRALIGNRSLTSRSAVSGWAALGDQALAVVATIPLGPSLAPGAVAPFRLVIPATAISHRDSFAVLPVSIDVIGATPDTAGQSQALGNLRTFLPALSPNKEYEPLSIAWLVPLCLDPDAALLGADGTARTAAWTKAIGPGSRLDGVITGTDSTKVTWAIDPAVLGPPQLATASPTPTPSTAPAPGGATSTDPVTEATTALANRLREAAPRHTLWSLPYADPDLAALLPLASGQSALAALLGRPSGLAAAVGSARTGIAWPVDGALSTSREQRLRAAFSSSGLAGAVVSASTRTMRSGYTDDASRKSVGGLPLLAYDQALSRTFAQTSAAASGAVTTQLFLADSLALLGERPGTPNRSVLVAAPRTFAGNPTVLAAFFAAVAQAPWLTPTSTEQLLAAAGTATPDVPGSGPSVTPSPATPTSPSPTTSPTSPTSPTPPDPLSAGRSPLTAARLQNISRTTLAIDGVASIRDDTQSFRARWTDAQEQVLSSRWRGHARGITVIDAATQAAITAVSSGVRVVPSSVNFFADRGVLQVTVVNDLAVPVHDVHLTLTPGQPRLRIDQQSGPLRIGAKSRTNVKLSVTAIAAGLVPVEAVLTTPNGTLLGQEARVNVRVQPTGTWLYGVLGGLASIILLLGIYRSLRRGSTHSPRRATPEILPDE